MEGIQTTIENYLTLTKRNGIENLIAWMDLHGFYDAPCSSKYHLAEPGGLAKHSLNVLSIACSMIETLYIKQSKPFTQAFLDSVVICALLHDLGKAGQFGKPNYRTIPKHDESAPFAGFIGHFEYETNKDLLYVPHEVRSIAIASRFIKLTEEEQFAILYHNGLYGELQSINGKETELYMLLHWADMWASRVIEN